MNAAKSSAAIDVYSIRKWYQFIEETHYNDAVFAHLYPGIKRAVVAAAIKNPYANQPSSSLEKIFQALPALGEVFGQKLLQLLAPLKPESYGKAALVGALGEFEHGKAFLTTDMVNSIRALFGNAKAWVPSTCKRAEPGESICIPLACKDALEVNSHEDAIDMTFHDGPASDEVIVIFAASTGGRPAARLGGLTYDAIAQHNGLR